MIRSVGRTVSGKRVGIALIFAVVLAGMVAVGQARTAPPDVAIAIQGFAFVGPGASNTLAIPIGTKVTWTENDAGTAVHSTTSDTAIWDSGLLSVGQTFSQTFNQAGTFTYHCSRHGSMTGKITVVDTSAAPSEVAISIKDLAFVGPGGTNALTILAGTKVTWTENDPGVSVHSTTSDTAIWDSGLLSAGQSFSFTFDHPGIFTYHCIRHGFMTGTITVLAATPLSRQSSGASNAGPVSPPQGRSGGVNPNPSSPGQPTKRSVTGAFSGAAIPTDAPVPAAPPPLPRR